MKRKLENSLSLRPQIESLLARWKELYPNQSEVIEKLEAIYNELSDENLLLGLLKLMQFYNLKPVNPSNSFNNYDWLTQFYNLYPSDSLDDNFDELKTVLLPIFTNHVIFDSTDICSKLKNISIPQFPPIEIEHEGLSSLTSYDSFDGIRLMLNHEIFKNDPRLLERLANKDNFSNCIIALSLFYRAKILNLPYYEIILELDVFHSKNSEKFSILLIYLIRSKVELKKEDIQEIAKATQPLIEVIVQTPIHWGLRLGSDTIISLIAKNLNLLAHHKLLKSELLNYLYYIYTNEDKRNIKNLIAEKIPALIELSKELSLDNPYILQLFETCRPKFQTINHNEPIFSTRVKNQLDFFKKEYYTTLFLLMRLANSEVENPWALLPIEILNVILGKCFQSSNQQSRAGFFKSEQIRLENPELTVLESHCGC